MAKRRGSRSRSRSSSKSILGMNNCLLVGLCVSVVIGFIYFLKQSGVIKEGAGPGARQMAEEARDRRNKLISGLDDEPEDDSEF